MARSTVFRFKEFSINQAQSAMKIGTDGVLLGAWADHKKPNRILDIGAGTGLLSLMLAQRFPLANVDAVEIDQLAYEEASENVSRSKFRDRIKMYQSDFRSYESNHLYDLIVSNPPYFHDALKSERQGRNLARHTDSLELEELIDRASKILSDEGKLSLIIPFDREMVVIRKAQECGLHPVRIVQVKGRKDLPYKRSLIEFGPGNGDTSHEELIIEIERHQYTEEYKQLTQKFYLNM